MEVENMDKLKRLPDAEFDIMKVVWVNEPPITTNIIMQQLGDERKWKAQTTISLLMRLVERGFLRTEKNGKERTFFPLISKEDYLRMETGNFAKHFHNGSFLNLVTTLYDDETLSDKDIDELYEWVKKRRG